MTNSDQENNTGRPDFYERYSNYTDAQLLDILNNQKDYQESARNAAVKVALERQLIHSEYDLLAPEYQKSRDAKLSFFPQMPSNYHYNRMFASIFRFLFIFSFLPVIYGVLSYSKGKADQAILGISVGVVWFLFVSLFKRTHKSVFFILLVGILIFSGVLSGIILFTQNPFKVLDIVMFAVGLLLPAYFLIYAKKLTDNKPVDF